MSERPKHGVALVYLRRSSGRQEASLSTQLEWAHRDAPAHGVTIRPTQADLDEMLGKHIHEAGDLFVDDGITGADMNRPGLTALRRRALADRSVSHIFIHMPDRLARPKEAIDAAIFDITLRNAGMTIVFSNRTAYPRQLGERDFADLIQTIYQYNESGEYLEKLAHRVIEGQAASARKGYWTGGRAPYGFERVLVDSSGNVIQPLLDGMHIRQDGCHVRLRVKDQDKIRIWTLIFDWYEREKIGSKRIARRLNELGIPSPDAGRTRTDHGRKHRITGRWNPSTVLALIKNRAITGIRTFGVQSEGKHRRLGVNGPRLLRSYDYRLDGAPKVMKNPEAEVIVAPGGYDPQIEPTIFDRCQSLLKHRGHNQRGITRQPNPGKYPLATRVFDISRTEQLPHGCGHPMYGMTSGARRLYTCGRYMKTSGAECAHNAVDAEAALKFVLKALRQVIDPVGGNDSLRRRLCESAHARPGAPVDSRSKTIEHLNNRARSLEAEEKAIAHNLARAKSDAELELFREEYASVKAQRQEVQTRIAQITQAAGARQICESEMEREIDAAVAYSIKSNLSQKILRLAPRFLR